MTLTAIQGGAEMFKGDGFIFEYPTKESRPTSAGFGYGSDMMALAVNRDDPRAFMFFLDECGGPEVEVLISGTIFRYAASHGASRCLDALFDSGAKSEYSRAYWLKQAEKPSYGPNAGKLV